MSEPTTNLDAALAYAGRGWHVFPVGAWDPAGDPFQAKGSPERDTYDRAKRPLSMAPGGVGCCDGTHAHAKDDATTDAGLIRRWWAAHPDARVGYHAARSGLAIVDDDSYGGPNPKKAGRAPLPTPRPTTLTVLTPSNGRQELFPAPPGCSDSNFQNGEVLHNRYGILPSPGSGYRFENPDTEVTPVDDVALEAALFFGGSGAAYDGPAPEGDVLGARRGELEAFLASAGISGYKVAARPNGGVFAALDDCPFGNHGDTRSAWVGRHPSGAWVAGCHHNGCGGQGSENRWAELRAMVETPVEPWADTTNIDDMGVTWKTVSGSGSYAPDPDAIRYDWVDERFSTVEDMLALPPIQWLVPGLLQVGATAQIVGPSTGGKSLWTLQTCVGLALEGHSVVYCALEGRNGFNGRLRAQMQELGIDDPGLLRGLLFYDLRLNLYGDDAAQSVADLRAGLRLLDADVVVVDTLIRSAPGIKENDSGAMQAVIDHADSLKHRKDVSIWLVHHSGHDQMRGRGSSAVPAAMDNTVFIFPVGSNDGKEGRDLIVKVYSDKIKDGRQSEQLVLKRHEHMLGTLRDGSQWTSVVFRPAPLGSYDKASNLEARVQGWIEAGVPWKAARNKVDNMQRPEARDIWTRLVQEGVCPIEL